MIEIGRLCVKTAGRDAGKSCIIIEVIDNTFVMVDGLTRRKKVNIKHLEPLKETVKINKNASHEEVLAELEKLGIKEKKKNKIVKKEKKAESKEEKERSKEKKIAKKITKKDKI